MADRLAGAERKWVMVAIAIIIAGIAIAVLHRLGHVPLWAGTAGTLLMGIGALLAAIAAAKSYRNDENG